MTDEQNGQRIAYFVRNTLCHKTEYMQFTLLTNLFSSVKKYFLDEQVTTEQPQQSKLTMSNKSYHQHINSINY